MLLYLITAGLVGIGTGHVALSTDSSNTLTASTDNKTVVYVTCPVTCNCSYDELGRIKKATCIESDPAILLSEAQFIQELVVSDCSGQLRDVNMTSEEVGGIEHLSLINCPLEPENLDMFKVFTSLTRLNIEGCDPDLVRNSSYESKTAYKAKLF